ncbi:hypothetical protein DMP08_00380 [Paraeggerthella hongkongensis]|uniref:Uncharacterized protein n=1 Tax=Paraeggerthella hongkongensis TaxID=230658 RepID=A0A3N0BLJ9_9ACTN|nr:hypothetical protein DMP08_00380 [Paraeggerthella hongkongensis]
MLPAELKSVCACAVYPTLMARQAVLELGLAAQGSARPRRVRLHDVRGVGAALRGDVRSQIGFAGRF